MRATKIIMGMPITVEIAGEKASPQLLKKIFTYFRGVDAQFSPYKKTSEVERLNRGEIDPAQATPLMKEILKLSRETKKATNGYFDISRDSTIDPSGIVKGYAIMQAAIQICEAGVNDFYIEAGGDIQTGGKPWRVGIRNPFVAQEIVQVLQLKNGEGIATSGTQFRGDHVYDPHTGKPVTEIVSLSVIAQNVYEADRMATAAFAMGRKGIYFIEAQPGLEGYMIDGDGIATKTTGWSTYSV